MTYQRLFKNLVVCDFFFKLSMQRKAWTPTDVLFNRFEFPRNTCVKFVMVFCTVVDWCHRKWDKLPDTDDADVQIPSVCAEVQ